MARPENRLQLMAYFGAVQLNTVWSWCAVNESEKAVYLSVWTDHVERDRVGFSPPYLRHPRPH